MKIYINRFDDKLSSLNPMIDRDIWGQLSLERGRAKEDEDAAYENYFVPFSMNEVRIQKTQCNSASKVGKNVEQISSLQIE